MSRKNISYQNEKLNFNKNEISNLKNSLLNREKENENLVKKVAETTLSNKMMIQKQEPLKKRIDSLEQLNKTLQSQIDDLKKSRVVSKKENLNEGTISEKPKQDPSLPSGLYDLLKELVDKPGLGISYTLKIKNYLNDIDPPQTKKPKVMSS